MPRRTCWILVVSAVVGLCCLSPVTRADPAADPDVPSLRRAKEAYAEAAKQARTAYDKAMIEAKTVYLRKVQAAVVAATKAGNLDQANAINAIKKQLESEIDELKANPTAAPGAPRELRVSITAQKDWHAVARVRKGDRIQVQATGKWSSASTVPEWTSDADGNHGPAGRKGAVASASFNTLVGRIGADAFVVGKSKEFTAEADGVLEFRMNGWSSPSGKSGMLQLKITVAPERLTNSAEPGPTGG